ncbi:MAG: hypothetical protein JST54_18410 [Deltaproteobacteria bacterium]|nr:hypothetical protein [Deltaproteobacteria bacterium]
MAGGSFGYVWIYLILGALSSCTCAQLAGSDEQLREAAKGFEKLHEQMLVDGRILHIQKLQITRITPEPELEPPQVAFSYDLEGSLQLSLTSDLSIAVSALGVEKVPMVQRADGWVPQGEHFPRLATVLPVLARSNPAWKWYLRVDLDKAEAAVVNGADRKSVTLLRQADGGYEVAP